MKASIKNVIALAIPVVFLVGLTFYHQILLFTQTEYVFAIEGYDPRDLLSGNYIQFRIRYDIPTSCETYVEKVAICLKPERRMIYGEVTGCEEWISGECRHHQFEDHLNRFYIPQDRAAALEARVRAGKTEVKVSVGKGSAIIKDLLIDGKSWKEAQ